MRGVGAFDHWEQEEEEEGESDENDRDGNSIHEKGAEGGYHNGKLKEGNRRGC